jgi:heme oxygenase
VSLREAVADKHEKAEQSNFAKKLLDGSLSTDHYAFYLTQMLAVYSMLEHQVALAGHFDGLNGLARCRSILEDLKELCPTKHYSLLSSTNEYVNYLSKLLEDENFSKKILAHLYVRHMGDLHGGQIIAKKVSGEGRFYKFNDRQELIKKLREKLSDDLAEEANVAFDYVIKIMEELDECSLDEVNTDTEFI